MSDPTPAEDLGRVHLVGVGGAGMSAIARILLARGVPVSGSDAKESRTLTALRALGARVEIGHDPAHLGAGAEAADTVVVSTAIRPGNPELVAARERGLRVLRRAEALAAVMVGSRGVAVAGTHGKTTTTSMLTVALQHCGADPSYAIGGDLNEPGTNAHHGTGSVFVAEADESDGSFLLLRPYAAVVTNVEPDHLDHYGSPEAVARSFADFVDVVDAAGFVVACADDEGAQQVAARAAGRGLDVRSYGTAEAADVRIDDLVLAGTGSRFEVVARGRRLGPVTLRVPGVHNARNAAAALAAGLALGFSFADLRGGLETFGGARRRFELKGDARGVRVFDDYAHHPTEVAAALAAARVVSGAGRLHVVFQPHLFSRTAAFAAEFGAALGAADEVVVMDVYAAREDPVPGVTGALVSAAVPLDPARVHFEPSWSAVAEHVAARVAPGDVVMTVGAGDVTLLGPEILEAVHAAGVRGPGG